MCRSRPVQDSKLSEQAGLDREDDEWVMMAHGNGGAGKLPGHGG